MERYTRLRHRRRRRREQKKREKRLTVRQLYQLIVGEGGVDADYFLREMGPAEADDFIVGYSRRQRSGWEQSRLLADVVCKVMGGEGTGMKFPWEKEEEEDEADHREDEIERVNALREYAKEIEKRMEEEK